ncbi:unnamed protein product [Closterium sp. NIES-54]
MARPPSPHLPSPVNFNDLLGPLVEWRGSLGTSVSSLLKTLQQDELLLGRVAEMEEQLNQQLLEGPAEGTTSQPRGIDTASLFLSMPSLVPSLIPSLIPLSASRSAVIR